MKTQKEISIPETSKAIYALRGFIGTAQLAVIGEQARHSEEAQYFRAKLVELADTVATMPKTYEQDGKGDNAVAYLHYFTGSADFYITEKDAGALTDTGGDYLCQCFGLACISEEELGYISLPEILAAGAELDLHFRPKTLADVKATREFDNAPAEPKKPTAHAEGSKEKFDVELADLLATIKDKAQRQYAHSIKNNIPAGILTAAEVIPNALAHGIVSTWSERNGWAIEPALQLAAELLEDVNAHEEAAYLYAKLEPATVAA